MFLHTVIIMVMLHSTYVYDTYVSYTHMTSVKRSSPVAVAHFFVWSWDSAFRWQWNARRISGQFFPHQTF